MRYLKQKVSLYSFAHALVDFSCAWIILSNISDTSYALLLLVLYNFLAFALQMPIGLFYKDSRFAVIGCIFVLAAFLPHLPVPVCVLLSGVGNALFHVGAGTDLLYETAPSASASGIFVSTGAFGLWLGTKLAKTYEHIPSAQTSLHIIIAIALILTILLLIFSHRVHSTQIPPLTASLYDPVVILCLFLVTALRSWLGLSVTFSFQSTLPVSLLLILGVVTGKMLGGILYDRIGHQNTIFISLIGSSVLFLFPGSVFCAFASLLLFNMTMPVTLCMMAQQLKNAMGFAFGLLTFALFIGYLPVALHMTVFQSSPVTYSALCIFSLVLLLISERKVVTSHGR